MLSDQVNALLSRIDEAKAAIDENRPLSSTILKRLHEHMVIEWTYNSNAIEGNTLTLKETQLVLQEGITVRNKPLKEHLETINHKNAIEFVEEIAKKNTKILEKDIKEIHSLILKGIDPDYCGKYRDMNVRITGSKHSPPDALLLLDLMRKFSKHYLNTKDHPVVAAAKAHHELVSIHPFVDGNGRTARLLMNLILVKHGYFPAIILKNDRFKYYKALEDGHNGDVSNFIFFVGRSLERTINLYLEAIPSIKEHFITLKEASQLSNYSMGYLNVMARRGVIPAFKLKRNWVVSKKKFIEYVKYQKNK